MKAVTIQQVIAWNPCGLHGENNGRNYTPERITKLFTGRDALTASDIVALDIPVDDQVWALLHSEFLTENQMHLAACDFAEAVLPIWEREYPDDDRPRRAIEAKRGWVAVTVSGKELAAAWDAARAAGDAAGAAGDAAGADQLEILLRYIEEE